MYDHSVTEIYHKIVRMYHKCIVNNQNVTHALYCIMGDCIPLHVG